MRHGEGAGVGGSSAGARSLAWALAARGIAWIRSEAVPTSQGLRFRLRETSTSAPFPPGIYDGASGVALVLAAWARAAGDEAVRERLREVADGLVASASPHAQDASLYFGDAGRITALLHAAAVLRAPDLRDAAIDQASVLLAAEWELPDLLYGPAGTGLVALQVHRATGDRRWLRAARRALGALDAMAIALPGGTAWRLPTGTALHVDPASPGGADGPIDTGIAHGVGGILLFLDEAVRALGSRSAWRLRTGADAWLDSLSARAASRGRSWPKALGDDRHRHHWCHGTAGLALLYAQRAHVGGRGQAAAAARASEAARHSWVSVEGAVRTGHGESACHCHGLAGTLDALVAVERLGARWPREPIARLVDAIARRAGAGQGPTPFGLTDAGLAMGASGVVFSLMRAAGLDAPAPWEVAAVPSLRGLHARLTPSARVPRATAATPPARPSAASRDVPPAALPPVAAEVRPGALVVATTAADRRVVPAARRLLASDRAAPIREAWARLSAGLAELADRRSGWVHAGALAPERHLALMHRIAGITLHGAPDALVRAHRARTARFLVDRHLAAVATALDHIARDRTGLLADLVHGPLQEFTPLESDPHRGGQRAVALRFARGAELVFKPRDVRLDAFVVGDARSNPDGAAVRLNARLAGALRARIPTHTILGDAATHGYAERLAPAVEPVRSGKRLRFTGLLAGPLPPLRGHHLGSPHAFWRSAGALAAHLATFRIGDQHSENVFLGTSAADGAPRLHAIDCEVAFEEGIGIGSTQLVPSRSRSNPEPPEGPHTHFGFDARQWPLCGLGAPLWSLTLDARGRLMLVDPPGSVQQRPSSPVVISPDGSTGYGAHMGAVVRGVVEHWLALRAELPALQRDLQRALAGVRVRVLRKPTADYVLAVTQRELGSPLWPGALASPRVAAARAFDAAELAQLDALDVPAFDRALLTRRDAAVPLRAATADALAIGIGEVVEFAAPAGVFAREDQANGVTIIRETVDAPIQLAVAMPRGVAQFRLEPDGSVTHWGLPPR